jgi:hypothetical protein
LQNAKNPFHAAKFEVGAARVLRRAMPGTNRIHELEVIVPELLMFSSFGDCASKPRWLSY